MDGSRALRFVYTSPSCVRDQRTEGVPSADKQGRAALQAFPPALPPSAPLTSSAQAAPADTAPTSLRRTGPTALSSPSRPARPHTTASRPAEAELRRPRHSPQGRGQRPAFPRGFLHSPLAPGSGPGLGAFHSPPVRGGGGRGTRHAHRKAIACFRNGTQTAHSAGARLRRDRPATLSPGGRGEMAAGRRGGGRVGSGGRRSW